MLPQFQQWPDNHIMFIYENSLAVHNCIGQLLFESKQIIH